MKSMRNSIHLTNIILRERGYLLGFYVGDGNIFVKIKTGAYRIKFFLNRNELAIEEKLRLILVKAGIRIKVYNWKHNTKVIEIHSKDFVSYIQQKVTKNGIITLKKSPPFLIGYIEGLIDSDGYVQRKYAEITTSRKELKAQTVRILETLGMKSNIRNYISPISGNMGWRIGFSLKNSVFRPAKWVSSPQTAESELLSLEGSK